MFKVKEIVVTGPGYARLGWQIVILGLCKTVRLISFVGGQDLLSLAKEIQEGDTHEI